MPFGSFGEPSEESPGNTGILMNRTSDGVWSLPVYFGTPKQNQTSSSFIPSTLLSSIFATSTNCTDCENMYYNWTNSSSAVFNATNMTTRYIF